MRGERVTVTPGFLLLLGMAYYLDEGMGLFWRGLAACVCHELGHYIAARRLGGRMDWFRLSAVGAEMGLSYRAPLSYPGEMAVVLAGPVVNLLLGGAAAWRERYLTAAVQLGLGLFNALPILPLDGGKALWNGLANLLGHRTADRVLAVSAGLLVGLVVGAGLAALRLFANGTLLLVGVWLLWIALRKGGKKTAVTENLYS